MKILFIEPYHGGSHKNFLDDLTHHLPLVDEGVKCEIVSLPPRHWRWRITCSHYALAEEVNGRFANSPPEAIIANSIMDTAAFRGLLAPSLRQVPLITFFHENQMVYPINKDAPNRKELEKLRDYIYPVTHLNQILASDGLIFNSHFNLRSLFEGVEKFLKKMPDAVPLNQVLTAKKEARVLGLGCQVKEGDDMAKPWEERPCRILWNHRWEYDKNPEEFIDLFKWLKEEQLNLEVDLLGAGNQGQDLNVFDSLKRDFPQAVKAYGGINDRAEYFKRLRLSRLLPVTSYHDFFGLSVLDAITNGVIPLLPDRLAYPELIPKSLHPKLLYSGAEELKVKALLLLAQGLSPEESRTLMEWVKRYDIKDVSKNFLNIVENM